METPLFRTTSEMPRDVSAAIYYYCTRSHRLRCGSFGGPFGFTSRVCVCFLLRPTTSNASKTRTASRQKEHRAVELYSSDRSESVWRPTPRNPSKLLRRGFKAQRPISSRPARSERITRQQLRTWRPRGTFSNIYIMANITSRY